MRAAPKAANVWQPDPVVPPGPSVTGPGLTADQPLGMKMGTQSELHPEQQSETQALILPVIQPLTHSRDFARARRIVKTDEFSSVFHLRPVFRTAHFVLYTRTNALTHARLGVVAAKRLAPRAVTRNTVKRVTRELFRTTSLPAIDCIVRLSKPVNVKKGPATNGHLKILLRNELLQLFASQRTLPCSH